MRLKSIVSTILGVSLLVSAGNALAAKTELKVWCWDDNFNVPAARDAAARYMAKHPDVNIKVESLGQPDIIQKLNASLGANNVRGLPDIVLIEDYRVQNFLTGYPKFLKPLTKIDHSKFVDFKVAASSDSKNNHYGVPFDSGVVGNFIRTDIFQQAGYSVDDLKDITWDQFIEMGKKVKEKTGTYLIGYDPSDLGLVRILMQSAGSWYTDAEGKVNLVNNPAFKKGLSLLKDLQDNDLVLYYSGWNQLLASFQQGKVASVVQGCWITPSIEAGKDQAGKWAVLPVPKLDNSPNATHYSNLGGSQWFVNNYSKNADIAEDFLKETFASDTELLNNLLTKISLVNSFKDSSSFSNYEVKNEFFGGQQIYKDFSNWNSQIPAVSYGAHTYTVENLATEALQRVLGGEDIESVLEDTETNAKMQIGQ